MSAPPRIRILPFAAIALALAAIYLAWYQPRPASPAPAEPVAAAATSPAVAIPTVPITRDRDGSRPEPAPPAADAVPAIPLAGRITDTAGEPLGGILVELRPRGDDLAGSAARARSDRQGEFGFDAVTPGRRYQLRVAPTDEYAGYIDESLTFDVAAPRLDIVLERIVLVDADGIVVDTSRAPVPGYTLRLRSATTNIPDRVITSDASGNFRLEGFPAGALEINTSGRDYYRIQGVELRAETYNYLTLIVDHGQYGLSGVVVDADGEPVAGARVTLKGAISAGDYHTYSYRTKTTNTDGSFAFADLGSYRYTVSVHAAGFETQIRNHEFQSFSERLEIRLQYLPVD